MDESRPLPRLLTAACWLIGTGSLLAACASQTKLHETELAQLMRWLPGSYNNASQAQTDAQQGVQPPHERLALAIVALDAPSVTRDAFYMQEMAADDPRRVMSQKVLTFRATDQGIVASVWSLTDPRRWRDAYLNPELFRGMVLEDLGARAGCELLWKKTADRFVGASERASCRGAAPGVDGTVQIESRMELGPDELALAELGFDASGRLVLGRQDEPFYRFRKQAP